VVAAHAPLLSSRSRWPRLLTHVPPFGATLSCAGTTLSSLESSLKGRLCPRVPSGLQARSPRRRIFGPSGRGPVHTTGRTGISVLAAPPRTRLTLAPGIAHQWGRRRAFSSFGTTSSCCSPAPVAHTLSRSHAHAGRHDHSRWHLGALRLVGADAHTLALSPRPPLPAAAARSHVHLPRRPLAHVPLLSLERCCLGSCTSCPCPCHTVA